MAHIHDKPGQHDQTVTIYIVRTDGPEPEALLHMHRKYGVLLPVGGHVELDESPWQAAAHEILEESGYSLSELTLLQPPSRIREMPNVKLHPYPVIMNTHAVPTEHFHSDTAYAVIASAEPTGSIGEGESADLRWLTRQEIGALSDQEIYSDTRAICEFIFDECLRTWQPVPATSFSL